MSNILEERYGSPEAVRAERVQHRHHSDPLRKDFLASHMREPHPYGFSALNASQLMKWNVQELRREHDRMHVGERCEKCGEPLDDPKFHAPKVLGGTCTRIEDFRSSVAVECCYCGHTHAAAEVAICDGRAVVESLGEIPAELR